MLHCEKVTLGMKMKSAVDMGWNLTLESEVENLRFRKTSDENRKGPFSDPY